MPERDHNSEVLGTLISTWLAANERNAAWLAHQAGLNPSILSRFLNRKTGLNEVSALKLYRVMRWRMTRADQETFLAASGVLDLIPGTDELAAPTTASWREPAFNTQALGFQLMVKGYNLAAAVAYREALNQFLKAEQAFGPASTNAPRAVCEAIQCLVNLGDITRAEQEILRVAGQYDQVMDVETRVYYSIIRGAMELDRGNLDTAEPWFTECVHIAEATGIAQLADGAFHCLGLINLNRAQAAPPGAQIDGLLNTALGYFNEHLRRLEILGAPDWAIAFQYLRRAQVQQLQAEYPAAIASRRLAHELFRRNADPSGNHHVDIAEADLDLEEGNTRHAVRLAEGCLEDNAQIRYAAGMSRAVRIQAQAALQDGHMAEALEKAIAAVCINPYGTYADRAKLFNLLHEADANIRHVGTEHSYQQMLARFRARLNDRSGVYAYLNNVIADRSAVVTSLFNQLGAK
jgi:hypothetical protein